jgi:rhodanese-related sulfurtransferase
MRTQTRATLLAFSALLSGLVLLPGCASSKAEKPQLASGTVPAADGADTSAIAPGVVDGETARKLVAAGVKVVDVRTPGEFQTGHVPTALNIPFDEMEQRHSELGPPTTPVLVYCKTGRRSAIAIATLREKGFTQIYDLVSYDRWIAFEPAPVAR